MLQYVTRWPILFSPRGECPCSFCGGIFKLIPSSGTLRKHGHGNGNKQCLGSGQMPRLGSGSGPSDLSDSRSTRGTLLSQTPNVMAGTTGIRDGYPISSPPNTFNIIPPPALSFLGFRKERGRRRRWSWSSCSVR